MEIVQEPPARGAEPQLLDREGELAQLRAGLQRALGGSGRLVVIEGPAGAGKSSLVAAASELAASAGLTALCARASEAEREFAFGVVGQLFEPVLAAADESERARLLAGAAPAAWAVTPHAETSVRAQTAEARPPVLHAIHQLAINLAQRTPLLIAVDDFHWIDAPSLQCMGYLTGRIAALPVVVVLALRPFEPGAAGALVDELRSAAAAVTVAPGPLGTQSVEELVRARIPDADEEVCAACHTATVGNPLYLTELLRTLTSGRRFCSEAVREAFVPALAERVTRRIARMATDAPALVAAMAVLGDGGRLADAAVLAGLQEDEGARIVHGLRRIEVLASEDPFAFAAPLLRRSLYHQLSVTERDAAHTTAADLLRKAGAPAETIAAHLSALRPAGSGTVAATLVQASEQALARGAPQAAIHWLHRVLREGANEPRRALILAGLGRAEVVVGDMAAVGHLREALELVDDPALRARISTALAEILWHAGQCKAAGDVIATAVHELGSGDAEGRVEMMALQAVIGRQDSHLVEELDREREQFEELATGDCWGAHALSATLAFAAAFRGGGVEDVKPLVEQALGDGRLMGERSAGAWAWAQALSALVMIDEHDRALVECDELAARARSCGSDIGSSTALGTRAWVLAKRGELAAAEAELRSALNLAVEARLSMLVITSLHHAMDAILERTSLDDLVALADSTRLDPASRATWGAAMLLEVRGRLCLARGDRVRALETLRELAGTCAELRVGPEVSSWRSALALVLPPEEGYAAACLVAEELELARSSGLARPYGVALRAAGLFERGDEGIERLRESVSTLEGSDARLEHARSLVDLGAALRRRNRRPEARERLTAGMDLAHRCGASRLVERALEELHALGARPRRFLRTGIESLTASELRVARMAAEGRSNPEIAQELVVSLKTIETHLSQAYAKLGLAGHGSRGRLNGTLQQVAEAQG